MNHDTPDDHEQGSDPAAASGFEQLLEAADESHSTGVPRPGAVFFGAATSRPPVRRPGSTPGGTHRAAPRRAPRLPVRRAAGWATSARAIGAATAAGAVLLLASVGSGAVDLTGASSDSVLAAVAPGVATALGLQPDQPADQQTDGSPEQAITTWSRAEPSSGAGAEASTAPTTAPISAPSTADARTDAAADEPVVREPQVARPPVVEAAAPTDAEVQTTDATQPAEAPVDLPVVTDSAPEPTVAPVTTPEVTTPEVTTPEVTTPDVTTPEVTTPEVTTPDVTTPEVTTPEVTTPEVTTPEVTTPEVTTPEVTTPEVTTPDVTTPEVSAPSAGNDGWLVALTLGGIGLGTAGRHAVRRGRHRADRATSTR